MEQPTGSELWIAGRVCVDLADGHESWEFQGVFESHDKAVEACRDASYFIAPATLNESLKHEAEDWPRIEYPLKVKQA